jgi:hypothetical protein
MAYQAILFSINNIILNSGTSLGQYLQLFVVAELKQQATGLGSSHDLQTLRHVCLR